MISPVVEKRIEKFEALVDELRIVGEDGWTDYAFVILDKLNRLAIVLDDEHEDAEDVLNDCVDSVRVDSMADAFRSALKDQWVTTKEGRHIHLNEEGEPDAGNPYLLNAISGALDKKESQERNEEGSKCENVVSFEKSGSITIDKKGRKVTHFNHDENDMQITRQIRVEADDGQSYKICRGKIEHLTVFASSEVRRGVDVAEKLAEQVGGDKTKWKHVKGIGTVVSKDGKQRKADLHWFENPESGQVGWKIKQFLEDMDESKIYWKK